jgi:hypothetical protein
MPPLQDPELLARYKQALANWNYRGYVAWKRVAEEWVQKNLAGYMTEKIAQLMHEYVEAGGEIDQVPERRPEWSDYDFHYDLRIGIGKRLIYIETVLVDDDPDDPIIRVVSIHDA